MARKPSLENKILEIFESTKKPLTIAQCCEKLEKKGIHFHKTTFYRTIHRLQERGVIIKSGTKGDSALYCLSKSVNYFVTCPNCEKSKTLSSEVLVKLEQLLQSTDNLIEQSLGFKAIKHIVGFEGICPNCSKKMSQEPSK